MTEDSAALHGSSVAVDATVRPAWRMTTAMQAMIALGLIIAAVGTLTSRVDVVLLALPLLVSAALGRDRRPRATAPSTLRVHVARQAGAGADGGSAFTYRIVLEPPAGTELVQLRVLPQGAPVYDVMLAARGVAQVRGEIPVVHSGRQRVVDVSYRLIGADGLWCSLPTAREVAERVVNPAIVPIATLPLPHWLTGLTGTHPSARPGDGGEFRDLHPYAAGDRLRRIDWKATARRSQGFGDLYVRRTDATSDATVMLVMDSRDDVPERVAGWSTGPREDGGLRAMDLAREAAASVAVVAIGAGDRVGLIDLAVHDGLLAPGSGKRHLDRLLRRIAVSGPSGQRISRRRAPVVPPGAIVYLLTTFLDDEATAMARLWRAAGHRVIAVDLLPTPLLDGSARYTHIAYRVLMVERRRRIADARANGVELFRWQESAEQPSRAVALRTLARVGRRRR